MSIMQLYHNSKSLEINTVLKKGRLQLS